MEFKYQINPTLNKTKIQMTSKTQIPNEVINKNAFSQTHYNRVVNSKRATAKAELSGVSESENSADITRNSYTMGKVYAIRRHYDVEEELKKDFEQRKAAKQAKRLEREEKKKQTKRVDQQQI